MFTLNPSSGMPIYRQLIEQVRRMVSSGQLAPGDSLPSVCELALTHAVNPMTISKACSLMENEGLLERQRGKVMTVAFQHQKKANKSECLQPAVDHLAMATRKLELSPDEVFRLLRQAMEKEHDCKRT
jgi:GntR family transcriptional regulator